MAMIASLARRYAKALFAIALEDRQLEKFERELAEFQALVDANKELAWSQLCWLMAAGGRDILEGLHRPEDERNIVEGILRVMGVEAVAAHAATITEPPTAPHLPIDFSFEVGH